MKTALVHDWLVSSVGGGEKVLQAIHELFPSPIYTLIQNKEKLKEGYFSKKEIFSSWIERLPFAKAKFRSFLPFFPLAVEQFDLSRYDVILSSSHCVAKGVLTHADQMHICYCHTPMRYAWDLSFDYLQEAKLEQGVKSALARFFLHYLRGWDLQSAQRVDWFLANSKVVARRIEKLYGRKATVIYPPVDTSFYHYYPHKESYYVTASRLVSYKKIDLIVEAFSKMPDQKLIVIGDGPDRDKIRKKAGKNVELLGYQSDEVLREYLQKAKAFVFAAYEDFGILPVEAMACGTPVIAFGKGGAKETVLEGKTGIFFKEQTLGSLIDAVHRFETLSLDPLFIHQHAQGFSLEQFQSQYKRFVEEKYAQFLQTV